MRPERSFPGCKESPHFPSFLEGLSLRQARVHPPKMYNEAFPFLFGGAFIEAVLLSVIGEAEHNISLPFWRGFH